MAHSEFEHLDRDSSLHYFQRAMESMREEHPSTSLLLAIYFELRYQTKLIEEADARRRDEHRDS